MTVSEFFLPADAYEFIIFLSLVTFFTFIARSHSLIAISSQLPHKCVIFNNNIKKYLTRSFALHCSHLHLNPFVVFLRKKNLRHDLWGIIQKWCVCLFNLNSQKEKERSWKFNWLLILGFEPMIDIFLKYYNNFTLRLKNF